MASVAHIVVTAVMSRRLGLNILTHQPPTLTWLCCPRPADPNPNPRVDLRRSCKVIACSCLVAVRHGTSLILSTLPFDFTRVSASSPPSPAHHRILIGPSTITPLGGAQALRHCQDKNNVCGQQNISHRQLSQARTWAPRLRCRLLLRPQVGAPGNALRDR